MTGPLIFSPTNRLKQGKLASEKKRLPDLTDFIHTNEPWLIAFNEYANEEGKKSPSSRFTPTQTQRSSTWNSSSSVQQTRMSRTGFDADWPGPR
jgi:hypothetical protein